MQQPTAAPWAHNSDSQPSLPPVSQGETTTAPWARHDATRTTLQFVASIPSIQSHFPDPITDLSTHTFTPTPFKRITSLKHLQSFFSSTSARHFLDFILSLNESITTISLTDAIRHHEKHPSQHIISLLSILDTLDSWIDEIPPAQHTLRYGNPAFRTWFSRLEETTHTLLAPLLPSQLQPTALDACLHELSHYLTDSFGNKTRIDYGTGHETTFIAFLYCLCRLKIFQESDRQALVAIVYARYLSLMRRIQTTYWLEPAGSHGVWGLDDYQFLPFLWGSAQLIDHPYIKPSAILDNEAIKLYADDYLYLSCINFVKRVKKGHLRETSPMLVDISGVPSWSKINKGLIRMYQAEVLGKVPIMQHFLFGSLLPFESKNHE